MCMRVGSKYWGGTRQGLSVYEGLVVSTGGVTRQGLSVYEGW